MATNISLFLQLVGIAVERMLIGAEKSYGEKVILSAVAVFPLLYMIIRSTRPMEVPSDACCVLLFVVEWGDVVSVLARYSPRERERRRRMVLRLRVVQVTPR